MSIQETLKEIQERIRRRAERSGRDPASIQVVWVTKNVPPARIQEAFDAGARDFGENRVQEWLEKRPKLPQEIRWHFVGRLQTNKVKSLLAEEPVPFLHSLDRMELAEEIEKQAEKRNVQVEALIQVNTSGEAAKAGFAPEETGRALEKLKDFDRIRIRGLMTIGPFTEEEEKIRASFRKLCELRGILGTVLSENRPQSFHLSMGMSSDFEIAVEEGATLLRIGTALFGKR